MTLNVADAASVTPPGCAVYLDPMALGRSEFGRSFARTLGAHLAAIIPAPFPVATPVWISKFLRSQELVVVSSPVTIINGGTVDAGETPLHEYVQRFANATAEQANGGVYAFDRGHLFASPAGLRLATQLELRGPDSMMGLGGNDLLSFSLGGVGSGLSFHYHAPAWLGEPPILKRD